MSKHRKGTEVSWKWGQGVGEGKVQESFTGRVTRTIKGHEVTRNATPEEPAYLIVTREGRRVLKSESEVRKRAD